MLLIHRVVTSVFLVVMLCMAVPVHAADQYTVNKFNIIPDLSSGRVHIKLDSDIPDSMLLSVSVYRTYDVIDQATKQITQNYWPYMDGVQISTEELKKGVTYDLDNKKWQHEFNAKSQEDSALGIKALPKTISKKITLSVALIRDFQKLGNNNEKLSGLAVKEEWGEKSVSQEKLVTAPLNGAVRDVASLNSEALDIGHKYTTQREDIPLLPDYNPDDKMAALKDVKKLPSGTPFTIMQKKVLEGEVWYQVNAEMGIVVLMGWINSRALAPSGSISDR